METITVTEARRSLSDVFNEVYYNHKEIVLTNNSKKTVLIPFDVYEYFQRLEDADDVREAEIALADYEKNGGYTHEEVCKILGV